jgi:hypothetical protein
MESSFLSGAHGHPKPRPGEGCPELLARLCARDAMWAARASGWFLSAEAIAVFKLLFFRGKDVVDLQRLIAVGPELDRTYIRRWIVELMGEDDERTRMWDQLVARFSPP